MRLPWQRQKEETPVIENDEEGLDPGFDLSDGGAEGEGDEPEPEVSLDDFEDEETRGRVERLLAREREQVRAPLRDMGLDFNSDGRALIADAGKVSAWAGPVLQRPPPAAQTASPPAPAAQPAADDGDDSEIDLLSATPQDLLRFVDKRVSKQTKSLADENAYLRGLMQQRAASESVQSIRSIVEERLPSLSPFLDHPDFAATYEREIAGADPAVLGNPVIVAGLAASIIAGLDKERMPMPRDTQGRFTTPQQQAQADAQVRHLAARQGLQGTPPARGAGVQRGGTPPDHGADEGVGYLRQIVEKLPPSVTHGPTLTAAEWDAARYPDIESWKSAMDRAKASQANGARRR
jgi:hypothetical protein